MKKYLLFVCFCGLLSAQLISFSELEKEPNSLAKDFYINELLEAKKLSPEELKKVRKNVFRYAGKIVKNFRAAGGKAPKTAASAANSLPADSCWRFGAKGILKAPEHCQKLRLSDSKFAKKLSPQNLAQIAKKFAKKDAEFATTLRALASKQPLKTAMNQGNTALALRLFYEGYAMDDAALGPKARASFFRSPLAYKFLNSALVDGKFPLLRASLLKTTKPPEKIDADLAFALGLNFVVSSHAPELGEAFFLRAAKNYKFKRPRDNALWFAYLAGRDEAVLRQLAASEDLNIYSLYARELLGKKGYEITVPQPTAVLENEPISDALAQARWQIALKKASAEQLREWEQKYYARNTLGQYLAVHTRLHGFLHNIYPMPFAEHLADASTDEKALLYAIAMQESRFLPASVSTSYALGMMQFMPFVARHTAKVSFGEANFDATKMFEPAVALPMALAHVRTLKRGVNSPLFVAYAYNGGLGFTQRMLAKKQMFASTTGVAEIGDGAAETATTGVAEIGDKRAVAASKPPRRHQIPREEFEPFLSMELVPYAESRLYGKKVLANYYVYKNLLGERVSMKELFAALNKRADAELVEKNKEQK